MASAFDYPQHLARLSNKETDVKVQDFISRRQAWIVDLFPKDPPTDRAIIFPSEIEGWFEDAELRALVTTFCDLVWRAQPLIVRGNISSQPG